MIKILANKLKNSQPSSSVNSAALIIAVAGAASRLLGLVRDRILAAQFGAGDALDIYYAAFRVPDLIYNLLILGALSAAFIPVFTSLIVNEKNEEARRLASGLFTIAVVALVSLSAILAVFTPILMKLITPGFDGEKLRSVITITRIMFLSPIFLGMSGIFGGILNSFKRFLIYSIAPLFYNLGIIAGALFFAPIFGIMGLAFGVILGAFLHMAIQYPAVRLGGFKLSFMWDLGNANLRKVLRLMVPRTMGLAVTQVNLLVVTILASTLSAGSLAIFNFANNLQAVPLGVLSVPFILAIFPTLSHYAARENWDDFIKSFSSTFRQVLYLIVPASVLMLVLRAQIVRIVLGSGKFDWEDTILTFQALGIFSLSLFAQCLVPLLARSFYALHNTRIPFYTGLASEAVNLILAIFLSRSFGILGLVWAFSVASIVNMTLLFLILRLRLGNLDDKKIFSVISKIAAAAIISGIGAQLAKQFVGSNLEIDSLITVFTQTAVSASCGIVIYLAISYFFRLEEFEAVKKLLTGKFARVRAVIPEDPTEASGI